MLTLPTVSKLTEDPTVKLANPSSSGLTSLPLLGDWGGAGQTQSHILEQRYSKLPSLHLHPPGGLLNQGLLRLTPQDSDSVGPRTREFTCLAGPLVDAASAGSGTPLTELLFWGPPLRFLISGLSLATSRGRTGHSRKLGPQRWPYHLGSNHNPPPCSSVLFS